MAYIKGMKVGIKGRGRPKKEPSPQIEQRSVKLSPVKSKKEKKVEVHSNLIVKHHNERIKLAAKHSAEHKLMANQHKKEMLEY